MDISIQAHICEFEELEENILAVWRSGINQNTCRDLILVVSRKISAHRKKEYEHKILGKKKPKDAIKLKLDSLVARTLHSLFGFMNTTQFPNILEQIDKAILSLNHIQEAQNKNSKVISID